jgi:hypothetical protein
MITSYEDFLASKAVRAPIRGLTDVPELASHLFPFQRLSVTHALKAGCAGLFLDTGLGKTECQLEWCHHAMAATNGRALILTPLAVAGQTKRRADRWGYEARIIRDQSEADAVKAAIPGAVEIRGSMSIDQKEERLAAFELGQIKYLIAKPSMCGFGLDWSHCHKMAFVGRSYSYEIFYQAVRRCWRFGQKNKVIVDLIVAEGEDAIGRVIDRKSDDHAKMKRSMRDIMRRSAESATVKSVPYNPLHMGRLPKWLKSAA